MLAIWFGYLYDSSAVAGSSPKLARTGKTDIATTDGADAGVVINPAKGFPMAAASVVLVKGDTAGRTAGAVAGDPSGAVGASGAESGGKTCEPATGFSTGAETCIWRCETRAASVTNAGPGVAALDLSLTFLSRADCGHSKPVISNASRFSASEHMRASDAAFMPMFQSSRLFFSILQLLSVHVEPTEMPKPGPLTPPDDDPMQVSLEVVSGGPDTEGTFLTVCVPLYSIFERDSPGLLKVIPW